MNVDRSDISSKDQEESTPKTSVKHQILLLLLCLMPMFSLLIPTVVLGGGAYLIVYLLNVEDKFLPLSFLGEVVLFVTGVGLILSTKNLYKWYKVLKEEKRNNNK